jgi:hypothetical protein
VTRSTGSVRRLATIHTLDQLDEITGVAFERSGLPVRAPAWPSKSQDFCGSWVRPVFRTSINPSFQPHRHPERQYATIQEFLPARDAA